MLNPADKIWTAAQQILRATLSEEVYNKWFGPLRALGCEGDCVTLVVADGFTEILLSENYKGLLQDSLAQVTGQPMQINFQVDSAPPPLPLAEDLTNLPASRMLGVSPAFGSSESLFDSQYTFDSFVVGDNNIFAHAAALAVSKQPGKAYNPLFLYGGVGLGKTHLLHAIGQYVLANKNSARVAYVSVEDFTNEFIDALGKNQLVRFRKKYRETDLLLVDDVQFLSSKEGIQEEFFHTFNALHVNHKQIVLTCDRPAGEIRNLEKRLMSRFQWGLVADVQPPALETRIAILRKKAIRLGISLPEEIVHFIAQRVSTNIRPLEGALVRIKASISLLGKEPTRKFVEQLLAEILEDDVPQAVTIDSIQKCVAEHYKLQVADLIGKKRAEHIAFPRQVAMYLARQLTGNSHLTIGKAFGGRDHSTVMHAWHAVKDRMDVDTEVRRVVHYLQAQLKEQNHR